MYYILQFSYEQGELINANTQSILPECLIHWDKPCKKANIADRKGNEVPFEVVEEALKILDLAGISYLNFSEMTIEVEKRGWKVLKLINNPVTDTEGFVAEHKSTGDLVVSFRATEKNSVIDWLTDLMITPIGLRVKMHTGFYLAMNSVYSTVSKTLSNNIKNGKKVYITGISLGAGVAQAFTYRFAKYNPQYKNQLRMFSFATPPTGNKHFVKELYRRVPNHYDIVQIGDKVSYKRCCIPQALTLLGYRRNEVYYLPDKGAHNFYQYKTQLEGIQTKEGYDEKYGLNEDEDTKESMKFSIFKELLGKANAEKSKEDDLSF